MSSVCTRVCAHASVCVWGGAHTKIFIQGKNCYSVFGIERYSWDGWVNISEVLEDEVLILNS